MRHHSQKSPKSRRWQVSAKTASIRWVLASKTQEPTPRPYSRCHAAPPPSEREGEWPDSSHGERPRTPPGAQRRRLQGQPEEAWPAAQPFSEHPSSRTYLSCQSFLSQKGQECAQSRSPHPCAMHTTRRSIATRYVTVYGRWGAYFCQGLASLPASRVSGRSQRRTSNNSLRNYPGKPTPPCQAHGDRPTNPFRQILYCVGGRLCDIHKLILLHVSLNNK